MAQLQLMDACLDTLSIELYQVNVHVGRIARRQATMGGFALEATLSSPFVASDDDDGDDDDAFKDDDDGDASSIDEMSEGKSGFVSHTKLIAEATFMVLFHS